MKTNTADAPAQTWHHGNLHDALVQHGIEIRDAEGATALSRWQSRACSKKPSYARQINALLL